MGKVPSNITAANWKLKSIAEAHNSLNKKYFSTGEYLKYESYFKLGEAISWILKQYNAIPENISFLDIGCGAGWHAVYLQREGFVPPLHYVGFDLSPHMCELAKRNFPGGSFQEMDICSAHIIPKHNIVMESAVLELVHDWKSSLTNMLKSSDCWFISHRLFVKDGRTSAEQVKTYNEIPDVRFHIGMDDFKEILKKEGFELVKSDLWRTGDYNMGTYVCRSVT
jgi:SAM-dependent methyltransferase